MRLKMRELTRTAVRHRERLLIVCSVVAVVLLVSGISAAVAMTMSMPDGPSDHYGTADGSPPVTRGGAPSSHRPSQVLQRQSTPTAAQVAGGDDSTPSAVTGAEEAVDGPANDGVNGLGETSLQGLHPGAETDSALSAVGVEAASRNDTPVATTPPVRSMSSSTTSTTLSWMHLRGTTTTTTVVEIVSGYEVVYRQSESSPVRVSGNPAADDFVASGGIDLFVPDDTGKTLMWLVRYQGDWPLEDIQPGPSPGDGSWEEKEDGLPVALAPNSGAAAVAWESGFTDVFVRGADNSLYHRRGTNTWSKWENLGGLLSSDPAVASSAPGSLDVFVRGPFAHLWHRSFDGYTWSDWEDLGGNLKSEPAAVSRKPGQLDVFARGTDDALWHLSCDGMGWSSWRSLGGVLTSGPGVACSPDRGRLDVFVRGVGNTLWHMMGTPKHGSFQWTPWENLGGSPFASSPAAVSWAHDRIGVFVRGTDFETGKDDLLWAKWFDGATWLP